MRYRHLRRTAIAVLAAVAFVLLIAVLLGRVLNSSGVRASVASWLEGVAEDRGLSLEVGSLSWGALPPRVILRDAELTGSQFVVHLDQLEVELTRIRAARRIIELQTVAAQGIRVRLEGLPRSAPRRRSSLVRIVVRHPRYKFLAGVAPGLEHRGDSDRRNKEHLEVNKMSNEALKVNGFFRINITEDSPQGVQVVGDSGWVPNTVSQYGFQKYIADLIAADAASLRVSHAALGTGTASINSTQSLLTSELTHGASGRASVTAATSNTSVKVRWTGTFNSTNSFVTAAVTIGEIGLFQQSNTNTGSLAAGAARCRRSRR